MKTEFRVFVRGIPKAQPRPRMTAAGHTYNPDSADAWKEEIKVALLAYRDLKITKPVHLRVYFFMPVPKYLHIKKTEKYVPHIKKPDTDNLLKAVMDALTEIGVWKDDALVFWAEATKWYAAEATGAEIIIETYGLRGE